MQVHQVVLEQGWLLSNRHLLLQVELRLLARLCRTASLAEPLLEERWKSYGLTMLRNVQREERHLLIQFLNGHEYRIISSICLEVQFICQPQESDRTMCSVSGADSLLVQDSPNTVWHCPSPAFRRYELPP